MLIDFAAPDQATCGLIDYATFLMDHVLSLQSKHGEDLFVQIFQPRR